ncbi:hypothetical protein NDU88_007278 [Pleurodeles waltl]|uniref:Uncharacterized protein n=1 Tax=Pleurodeles waltl TaxID=8319 RepID=A0AAV7NVI3_PLEWA|nr:hypothetical protein NDU88_007278 [Pleurodeles waltl]
MWVSGERPRGGPVEFLAPCAHEEVDSCCGAGVWADAVGCLDRGRCFLVQVHFWNAGGAVGGNVRFGRTRPGLLEAPHAVWLEGAWYMTPAPSCARALLAPSTSSARAGKQLKDPTEPATSLTTQAGEEQVPVSLTSQSLSQELQMDMKSLLV